MIRSLGPGLETTDFIRIALGSQHTFIVVQNSNLSKPLVITWPQLLQQIQDQLNIISGGSTIQVQDEGSIINATAQFLNFIGAGVTVTQNGNGVNITIPGGGTGSGVWGAITGDITNQTDLVTYVSTQIAAALVNYVPNSRTITINGDTKDLSADRTWTINIPTYTANNGVQPESGNPTNFELGGSIIKNTLINVGPANSAHDLQFDSPGPLDGSGKIKFTATTGTYSSTDKLVRFEARGAISAYVVADGTNGTGIFIQSLSSGAIPMIISNASSAEILRMLNSGQLQLNLYNSSTAFSSGLTSVGILNVDNTGKVFVSPAPTGTGTVTSVAVSSGTGITASVTGNPNINPTINITNSAPDQTVVLSNGTGINVTGTYPNFTISNTAPDQTVVLSSGAGISVTGTYPNFTITNSSPSSGGTVTGVTATSPITSSGGTAPVISTSMATNKLIGRGTGGTGVMEEITLGTGLSFSGTTLNATGGGGLLYGTASGTNTYAVTITGVTSYTDGDTYVIKFTNGNDDDSSININGLGAKILEKQANIRVTGGDIVSGQELIIIYDGTHFQTLGVAPNQLFAYVTNDDSVTINKGQAVYAFGAAGNRMSVKLANNTSDSTSAQTVGLVFSSSIAPNQKGFIITQGVLSGVNTSAYSPGAQLYLGATAGALTSTKPYAPNHLVYIGIVERANAGNGQIYVKPQNGYELNELHDVDLITSLPTNNQVLSYQTGTPNLWKNKNVIDIAPTSLKTGSCGVTFDGGGQVVQNKTAYVQMPYNGTLGAWFMVADQTGACTIAVSKSTFTGFPSTSAVYSVNPAIPAGFQKELAAFPSYISGMATVTAGDVLKFEISSVTSITWVNLSISIAKT
jgi:hypothetical protein